MASATIETVTKTVTTEVEEEAIQLTLTKEEAEALYALTGFVTGSPYTSYARETRAIRVALGCKGAGLSVYSRDYFANRDGVLIAEHPRPHVD